MHIPKHGAHSSARFPRCPAKKMAAYKVSTRVNSPKNNDAEVIEAI